MDIKRRVETLEKATGDGPVVLIVKYDNGHRDPTEAEKDAVIEAWYQKHGNQGGIIHLNWDGDKFTET